MAPGARKNIAMALAAGSRKTPGNQSDKAAACLGRLHLCQGAEVLTADLSPENRAWLAGAYPGLSLRRVEPDSLRAAILDRHGTALRDEAVDGLGHRLPELSARRVVTPGQTVIFALLGAALLAAFILWPLASLRACLLLLSAALVASGLFRALLAWIGAAAPMPAPPLPRRGLPRYTILVPMYREAAVLPALVRALRTLDYPPALLDIKLVLEADDGATIAAAECCGGGFEIVRVPPHGPRTKPKAANYALQFARGEYLVIYDAEDRPAPDQLLKAVAAFRAGPRTLACVQARLNFYNADHNWLTRGIRAQTPQSPKNRQIPRSHGIWRCIQSGLAVINDHRMEIRYGGRATASWPRRTRTPVPIASLPSQSIPRFHRIHLPEASHQCSGLHFARDQKT